MEQSRYFSYQEKLAWQYWLVQVHLVKEAPKDISRGTNPFAVAALHSPFLPLPLQKLRKY